LHRGAAYIFYACISSALLQTDLLPLQNSVNNAWLLMQYHDGYCLAQQLKGVIILSAIVQATLKASSHSVLDHAHLQKQQTSKSNY
jgi:hypothetical protein